MTTIPEHPSGIFHWSPHVCILFFIIVYFKLV